MSLPRVPRVVSADRYTALLAAAERHIIATRADVAAAQHIRADLEAQLVGLQIAARAVLSVIDTADRQQQPLPTALWATAANLRTALNTGRPHQ